MKISASLVLYNNPIHIFKTAILSFLNDCDGTLYIIDNSPKPLLKKEEIDPRAIYIHSPKNIGFGAAHNRILSIRSWESDIHLILNPDISFEKGTIEKIKTFFAANRNIGAVMPQILYPNGEIQHLCKLLPTPTDLIIRRFIPFKKMRDWINQRYELVSLSQTEPCEVPSLSGCCLFVRTRVFRDLNGFDPSYFMYMEDVDLVRRIGTVAKTIYYPSATVTHLYAKESYKNKRLLGYHLKSAIYYFFKWGWFYDPVRKSRNKVASNINSGNL